MGWDEVLNLLKANYPKYMSVKTMATILQVTERRIDGWVKAIRKTNFVSVMEQQDNKGRGAVYIYQYNPTPEELNYMVLESVHKKRTEEVIRNG